MVVLFFIGVVILLIWVPWVVLGTAPLWLAMGMGSAAFAYGFSPFIARDVAADLRSSLRFVPPRLSDKNGLPLLMQPDWRRVAKVFPHRFLTLTPGLLWGVVLTASWFFVYFRGGGFQPVFEESQPFLWAMGVGWFMGLVLSGFAIDFILRRRLSYFLRAESAPTVGSLPWNTLLVGALLLLCGLATLFWGGLKTVRQGQPPPVVLTIVKQFPLPSFTRGDQRLMPWLPQTPGKSSESIRNSSPRPQVDAMDSIDLPTALPAIYKKMNQGYRDRDVDAVMGKTTTDWEYISLDNRRDTRDQSIAYLRRTFLRRDVVEDPTLQVNHRLLRVEKQSGGAATVVTEVTVVNKSGKERRFTQRENWRQEGGGWRCYRVKLLPGGTTVTPP